MCAAATALWPLASPQLEPVHFLLNAEQGGQSHRGRGHTGTLMAWGFPCPMGAA